MRSISVIVSVVALSFNASAQQPSGRRGVSPEERQKIESAISAIPVKPPAKPRRPRKLLVIDAINGRMGHASVPHANLGVELMGKKTGAYEAVISHDSSLLAPGSLKGFDAVFINNTAQGDLFNTPELRDTFAAFIRNGGGLVANHSVTVTSPEWAEFGEILGARGAAHRGLDEKIFVKLDDSSNPINRVFGGKGFAFSDSFLRFKDPSPRSKVHVLLSIDVAKTDMNQGTCSSNCVSEDGEYPISWVRRYGKGRVFYFSFGENPPDSSFWNPQLLQHYLAGIQYALGDLRADDTPSVKLAAKRK
jgi:hypothetical protein